MPYQEAFQMQLGLAEQVRGGQAPESLLLLEHPPVITLGRRATMGELRASIAELRELGVEVIRSTRGGLATYHGPGQLVAYVVGRLDRLAGSIPLYVHSLEQVVLDSIAAVGVVAYRRPGHAGIWTDRGKIAALGLAFDRGVTLHGLAINLDPDLRFFQLINPCGLGELGVSSVRQFIGRPVDPAAFRELFTRHFGAVFGRTMAPRRIKYN